MPKFKITYRVGGGDLRSVNVEAKNINEATQIADKDYHTNRTDWEDIYDLSIKHEPWESPVKDKGKKT